MGKKFTKVGQKGFLLLPDDATDWVAVLDNRTSLLWTVKEMERMDWGKAQAAVGALTTAGFSDWRLPTVEEAFPLADRTRAFPAIDIAYFPDCKSDWYWTSTLVAPSPDGYAWFVDFSDGLAGWSSHERRLCVRAVRSA